MDRYLNRPLDHDSVWSFIRGADAQQLRMIERQTGYHLRLPAPAAGRSGYDAQGALYRSLSVRSDAELAAEHERIATAVHEVVREHWEVETMSFHTGATVPTYQRLEWLD
jgi:hypothetical protein